jgi:hypothetical protein
MLYAACTELVCSKQMKDIGVHLVGLDHMYIARCTVLKM